MGQRLDWRKAKKFRVASPYQSQLDLRADRYLAAAHRDDRDPHKIIHDMAMAMINAGHADVFYHLPHVLAYFSGQLPVDEPGIDETQLTPPPGWLG